MSVEADLYLSLSFEACYYCGVDILNGGMLIHVYTVFTQFTQWLQIPVQTHCSASLQGQSCKTGTSLLFVLLVEGEVVQVSCWGLWGGGDTKKWILL